MIESVFYNVGIYIYSRLSLDDCFVRESSSIQKNDGSVIAYEVDSIVRENNEI